MRIQERASIVVLSFVIGLAAPEAAGAAVFTVNSAGDASDANAGNGICATAGGVCSLRAAIQESNGLAGPDTIEFAIGNGVQTITLGSSLPSITSPTVIDGTTQPGFSGTPLIVVNGNGNGGGLTVTAGASTLRGLVVINFSGAGITFTGGGGNVLETSYVGLAQTGATAAGNGRGGVLVDGSPNNRIGGPSLAQRNLISGNTGRGNTGGIMLTNTTGNFIQGNFIGTDVTGMIDLGNDGRGIAVSGSSNNVIGGAVPRAGNLISGNWATGVRLLGGSNNNIVQANFIGPNRTVTAFLKNDRGVQIRASHGNQVVGNVIVGQVYDGVLIWQSSTNNLLFGNIIAFSGLGPIGDPTEAGFNAVLVFDDSAGNRILSNSMFGNAAGGIDLSMPNGPTPNDAGDGDRGANNLQNFPEVTSAQVAGGTTTVTGTLNSTAATTFLIELFASPACGTNGFGEGLYPLGQIGAATDGGGNTAFNAVVPVALPPGWVVTATATDPAGNTSEFSACTTIG